MMRLAVTQQAIDWAREECVNQLRTDYVGGIKHPDMERDCPIGQAFQSLGWDRNAIRIHPDFLTVGRYRYRATESIRRFMRRWDRRRVAVPHTFVLRPY